MDLPAFPAGGCQAMKPSPHVASAAGSALLALLIAIWPVAPQSPPAERSAGLSLNEVGLVELDAAPSPNGQVGALRFASAKGEVPSEAAPPPTLKGVVVQGRDLRLYFHAGDEHVTARVGDVVAGWKVIRAGFTRATVQRGEQQVNLRLFVAPTEAAAALEASRVVDSGGAVEAPATGSLPVR